MTKFRKGEKIWRDIFQGDYSNGPLVHEKVCNFFNHQEKANLNTVRHYYALSRMAKINKIGSTEWWQKWGTLIYIIGGSVKW